MDTFVAEDRVLIEDGTRARVIRKIDGLWLVRVDGEDEPRRIDGARLTRLVDAEVDERAVTGLSGDW
jgi:hypothetical protein